MPLSGGARLSCLPVSLFSLMSGGGLSLAQWARMAKRLGFDGFDTSVMFLGSHTPVQLSELKQQLADIGLPFVMAAAYPDFTHPEAAQRRRELDYLRRDIALCSELGAKYVRVLAGQAHPGVTVEAGVAWAAQGLRQAAQSAAEHGVRLVYENHAKPGAWHYTDFSTPPDIFLKVWSEIRDTGIRINFDTGNPVAFGADPLELLSKVIDGVETLHVADMRRYHAFEPVLAGTGAVPLGSLFSLLKARGFNGWLCIEEASFNGEAGITAAGEAVRTLWNNAQKSGESQ